LARDVADQKALSANRKGLALAAPSVRERQERLLGKLRLASATEWVTELPL